MTRTMGQKAKKRFRQLTFLGKFSVLCLITLAATMFFTSLVIQYTFRHSALRQSTEETRSFVRNAIDHHLTEKDFLVGAIAPTEYKTLDSHLEKHMEPSQFVSINIWSRSGINLYSTDKELVGKRQTLTSDLKLALSGQSSGRFTEDAKNLRPETSEAHPTLLEFSIPIVLHGSDQPIGVYQVHKNPEFMQTHMRNTQSLLVLNLLVAAAFVYFFIYKVAKRVSKALIEKDELAEVSARLQTSLTNLKSTYVGTVKGLSAALDAKDHYTAFHSVQVARLATAIARLVGLPQDKIDNLEQAALFHDIGKIGIPGNILNKPAMLTPRERKVVNRHPHRGASIIQTVPFLQDKIPIIRYHHENFDGSGYPQGLQGERIPLEARILRIADTYDAITSDRPYRKAKTPDEAIRLLTESKGTCFDPVLVDLFVSWLQQQNIASQELVVEGNSTLQAS